MDSMKGYSTPPRSTRTFESRPVFSQAKLLTSSELKRRFTPIYSRNHKKRRHHFIPQTDSLVPSEHHHQQQQPQHLKMPVILKQLFTDENKENLLSRTDCDSMIPYPSPNLYLLDDFPSSSCKFQHDQTFSISETIIREKFKILFEKR